MDLTLRVRGAENPKTAHTNYDALFRLWSTSSSGQRLFVPVPPIPLRWAFVGRGPLGWWLGGSARFTAPQARVRHQGPAHLALQGLGLRGTLGSPKHRASCTVQHGPQGPPRTTRRSDFFISRPGGAHRGRRRLRAWLKASVAAGSQIDSHFAQFSCAATCTAGPYRQVAEQWRTAPAWPGTTSLAALGSSSCYRLPSSPDLQDHGRLRRCTCCAPLSRGRASWRRWRRRSRSCTSPYSCQRCS